MFTETVTVERPGGVDRYGDRLPTVSRTVDGCIFAPRGSSGGVTASREGASSGGLASPNTVITGLTAFMPESAAIDATDIVVRADGTRWEVQGEPGLWRSPFTGWTPGLQVALTRVEG